ncbi:TonB-dependent receptor [Muricauda sp. SCSIO 64092]|uniref:TonB-dependent receptor n=1 Tax=Allomuricauda sp. SCSIO 64092 TaxID=2908842 RepID=UPI001FF0E825|nr:TonB-dependent receptor [Muricauda sp. SCSIO 64092]UOY05836.1 TonB-dependent receptor [Muricauda sp. SCSIO 64092]
MKLTFTILLVSFLHLQATTTTYAQNTKLTIQMEGAKIAQIIETVESKSEFRFLFDRDDVDLERRVDIDVRAKKIGHILKVMFKGSDVAYNIENRQIVLNKSKQINRTQVPSIEDTVVQQEYRVTGTVTDKDGGPLPGANVVVMGTTTGVQTDFDGNFEITVPDGGILEISYVGFTPQRFTITEDQNLQVQLQEDLAALEEVVVVGYGTQKKVNLTGAVSSVDFEELGDTRPITNVSQGLAGQAPGVFVSQGSGKPGDDAGAILIRGVGTLNNASPLVVIDGIVGNLSDVIPENIANISILKDAASAAIYGSRAANGVVLVTTKTGTSGKMTLAYNGYTGFQTPTLPVDMIWNYPTHMELINQAQLNVGKPEIFSQATIDDYRAGTDPILYPNTNWFEAAFRDAFIQRHNITASGGSAKVRYLISANILDNRGNLKETDFKRYSFRSNVEAELNDWLTIGANVFGFWSDEGTPGDNIGRYLGFIGGSVPGLLPRDPLGRVGGPWVDGENASVNNIETNFDNNESSQNITKILGKLYTRVNFLKDFTLTTSFQPAIQYDYDIRQEFFADVWNLRDNTIIRQSNNKTALEEEYRKYYRLIFDSFLTYNKTIADHHNVGVVAGYNQEYETARNLSAFKLDVLADETTVMDAVSGADPVVRGNFEDRSLRSLFGRVEYNFKEKYLFDANIRYDGSSRFSENERWGVFPSVSAGWVISNEGFLEDSKALSFLKIRGSWGQLGNNQVADYGTQPLYNLSSYVFGGTIVPGAAPNAIPNDILRWETTTQTNIGVESRFFGGRLGMEFDWFKRRTDDILIDLPIPGVNGGLTAPPQNAGIVDNNGVELTLSWRDNIGSDFRYAFSGNFTYVKNEVVKYLGGAGTRSNNQILQEGLPLGSWYVREVESIATQERIDELVADGYTFSPMPSPGDFIYKDQQSEGEEGHKVINDDDRVAKGSQIPKYTFGFSLDLGYKGFDLNILGQGVAGVETYFNNVWYTSDLQNGRLVPAAALDAWTPENPNASFPRLTADGVPNNTVANDFWLMDASFLRIKNITLGYSLPKNVIQSFGMERFRLFLSAENYFTIRSSEFKGFDPELTGVNYPIMKRLTLGLNVNF